MDKPLFTKVLVMGTGYDKAAHFWSIKPIRSTQIWKLDDFNGSAFENDKHASIRRKVQNQFGTTNRCRNCMLYLKY